MQNGQSIVLNLAARYAAAFGMVAGSNIPTQVVVNKDDNQYHLEFFGSDNSFQKIVLEYDHVRLVFNSMIGSRESAVFAPPPLMTFSRSKKLVETEISGSDTVVIERWGNKSWEINIDGILVDVENRRYPDSEIQDIVSLFEYNGIIKAVSEQFYDKGIDSIYITSIELLPVVGYSDSVKYRIVAKSIKEVGFNLLENE